MLTTEAPDMALIERAAVAGRAGAGAWAPPNHRWRTMLIGAAGSLALLAFYLGIITWAQDWNHALSQMQEDLWFIAPITLGFGTQVGLFFYLRSLQAASAAGVAATAG